MTLLRPLALIVLALLCWLPGSLVARYGPATDSLQQFIKDHPQRDSIRVAALNNQAFANHLNNPDQALIWAYEALSISKEISYEKGEAQAMRQIGVVCWAQANYPLALKYFLDGLKIAERTQDLQTIADITGNIGLVYYGLGNYDEALKYHQRALDIQEKLNNKVRISVTLNNLGDVYRATKDFVRAHEHYRLAYQLREEAGNLPGMSTNIRNIGNVLEARGELIAALEQYQHAMKISDSVADKRGMSQCRYSIASVYYKMKRYADGKKFASTSLSIAKENNFRSFIRDNYLLLSQLDEALGNLQGSLTNFRNYTTYKDSVLNVQAASEIASYRLDYETEKQRVAIDLLRKDKQLQDAELAEKNQFIFFGSILFVLLIICGGFLLRGYRRQRSLNNQLALKNEEIESHHREILSQRDELVALNEEIRAQQDDLVASRDSLAEKNLSIARMNEEIITINENLEKLIRERTFALEKQNQQLIQYAFINAHKLRAPVARILGLANLAATISPDERQKILDLLKESAFELDEVTRSITEIVQNGIDAYQKV